MKLDTKVSRSQQAMEGRSKNKVLSPLTGHLLRVEGKIREMEVLGQLTSNNYIRLVCCFGPQLLPKA
jgi:hypothetical protein